MQFVMFIREGKDGLAALQSPEHAGRYLADWGRYAADLAGVGALRGGAGLQAPETGSLLRFQGSKPLVEDSHGFADEGAVSGFFVVEAPDQAAAVALAGQAPIAPGGTIEVRRALDRP